jgi:hypothetical protein
MLLDAIPSHGAAETRSFPGGARRGVSTSGIDGSSVRVPWVGQVFPGRDVGAPREMRGISRPLHWRGCMIQDFSRSEVLMLSGVAS